MREHLRSVKNSFRHRGESGFFGNPVIERLRTRCAPREGAGRPLVDGGEIPEQPPRPRETRNGGGLCGAILAALRGVVAAGCKIAKIIHGACETRPS